MKYVILLRGVNAGGKRKVPKEVLKEVLEQGGYQDVVVYINSGNAVFNSTARVDATMIQDTLEQRFGFSIPTLVLPARRIIEIADAIPVHWTNDPLTKDKQGMKSDVIYLFESVNNPQVLDQLGYNQEIETMIYVDGAVLTSISRQNQLKGSLQKIIGKKIYQHITIRNVNTARKLADLVR